MVSSEFKLMEVTRSILDLILIPRKERTMIQTLGEIISGWQTSCAFAVAGDRAVAEQGTKPYIDNVTSFRSIQRHCFNDNDNRNRAIDERADAVCRKMGNSGDEIAFKLYCKAFNHLSEATVWDCVELASSKGRTPVKYLSWLLRQELIKVNKW